MEARMSVCNMSIEAGARAGMVAPDEITFEYLKGRPLAPKGEEWDAAVAYWKSLRTDEGAHFDVEVTIRAEDIIPTLTWGTSPQDVVPITVSVPDAEKVTDPTKKASMQRSLTYMGRTPNTRMEDIKLPFMENGTLVKDHPQSQVVSTIGKSSLVKDTISIQSS